MTPDYVFTGSSATGVLRLPAEADRWRGVHRTGSGGPIVGVPRRPMLFRWDDTADDVVGTSAVALFSNRDQAYRKLPLSDAGEATDWVWLRPEWTAELVARARGRAPDDDDRAFEFMAGPVTTPVLLGLRRLTTVAFASAPPDPIALDELAIETVRGLVDAAYGCRTTHRARRPGTRRAHRTAVNDAAELIATRFASRLHLEDVAAEASIAPLHFCRIFRAWTGMTVHDYLTRVRLAAASERLADGGASLDSIAAACGFASGTHLSDTWERACDRRPTVDRVRLRTPPARGPGPAAI